METTLRLCDRETMISAGTTDRSVGVDRVMARLAASVRVAAKSTLRISWGLFQTHRRGVRYRSDALAKAKSKQAKQREEHGAGHDDTGKGVDHTGGSRVGISSMHTRTAV